LTGARGHGGMEHERVRTYVAAVLVPMN
jgi:hypothetical protein